MQKLPPPPEFHRMYVQTAQHIQPAREYHWNAYFEGKPIMFIHIGISKN